MMRKVEIELLGAYNLLGEVYVMDVEVYGAIRDWVVDKVKLLS